MDWTPVLIGAIPSVVSIIVLLIQIARDKKQAAALVSKTRAEAAVEEATAAETIADAAEKIVLRYERIIARMEEDHAKEIARLKKRINPTS